MLTQRRVQLAVQSFRRFVLVLAFNAQLVFKVVHALHQSQIDGLLRLKGLLQIRVLALLAALVELNKVTDFLNLLGSVFNEELVFFLRCIQLLL